MSDHGTLHMDPAFARDMVDVLREGAVALDVAAVYAGESAGTLEGIADRLRNRADTLAVDFWRLIDGEDVDWTIPQRKP